jgi:hypothetical protein
VTSWPTRDGRSLTSRRRAALAFVWGFCLANVFLWSACGSKPSGGAPAVADQQLSARGSVEVTARLVEIPEGAIFKRDLYDYATVLKYQVVKVHRGKLDAPVIYVAQYNPFKPRSEAADARAKEIGGNLKTFQAKQLQHMALEGPVEDYFMGGLVNKYFGKTSEPIYWAVWTNLATE